MAKADRKAFLLYYNWLEALERLDPADRWKTLMALIEYSRYGVMPELEGAAEILFIIAKPVIDSDREKYEHRCKVNAENGSKGGRTSKADNWKHNPLPDE